MEILRSLIIFNISESMKQKFVKDICLHLESIQCHLEGGFFGEWSIKHYVGKIIKSRYLLLSKSIFIYLFIRNLEVYIYTLSQKRPLSRGFGDPFLKRLVDKGFPIVVNHKMIKSLPTNYRPASSLPLMRPLTETFFRKKLMELATNPPTPNHRQPP